MGHSQLAGDVAGSNSQLSQLDDPNTDVVGQGAPIDKHASQLVDFAILVQLRV